MEKEAGWETEDSQVVLRLDDQTPACPDQARGRERRALREAQLLRGAVEVRDAGDDQGPFHDRRPEMDGLHADGTGPHAHQEGLWRLGGVCAGGGREGAGITAEEGAGEAVQERMVVRGESGGEVEG